MSICGLHEYYINIIRAGTHPEGLRCAKNRDSLRVGIWDSSLETERILVYIASIEMSTLEVKIPDLLLKQVNEVAMKEKVSVDQIVSIALAAQVSASQARESISSRAKRVDWQKVDDILARVPAQPPLPGDEVD